MPIKFNRKWLQAKPLALVGVIIASLGVFLMIVVFWGDDIMRHNLDPKVPFQTYQPPRAPDYATRSGWYLNPALESREIRRNRNAQKVDVFFIHATSFDGKAWLGAVDDSAAAREVVDIQLPNYAAPFSSIGYVYAPRYRQASLYTQLTRREDAREARQFAYGDVEKAFQAFLRQRRNDDGFIIVGVEQGGLIAQRLLNDVIIPDEALRQKLVAAYFLETLAPSDAYGPTQAVPACIAREQAGCVVAYFSVDNVRPDKAIQGLQRAMTWKGDWLEPLGNARPLCVNPLSGTVTNEDIDVRHSQGAANATGLEWGVAPALIPRKVSARCRGGVLAVNKRSLSSFNSEGSWADKKKVYNYNLFYGDLKVDSEARWFAYRRIELNAEDN
ncbi:DUF3089 domain-containing protein [Asticcacaulis tiandongensis]|uniref:DUF3089 domain-containing protein n=1 Tax=Asticcacaulis tiandongensis TaxID=2565365 RepID=UPI001127A1D5|nr:DUF3089 domain-containing protein [Asticcacaulis tiandongensis]